MNIKKIISQIIPPSDYVHRNGFSNTLLIDKLNEREKIQVETELINLLIAMPEDMLIVETLGYMKSKDSLPVLKKLLINTSYEMSKLIIASSIYEINNDINMVDIAIQSFKKLPNIYYLPDAFFRLTKFENPKINKIIANYIVHENDLVSNNAKRALGIHDSMN